VTAIPSVVSTNGLGVLVIATPDRLSFGVNAIDTFVLFHPAFGAGRGVPKATVGGVLSIRTVSVFGASWLPALSRAK